MTIPDDLLYTKEHEWIREAEGVATCGISDHAQEALGDVVFVELPEVGATTEAGQPFAVVESVKAVSDVYAPVSGEVIEVNEELEQHPELVNTDCYGRGWIARIRIEGERVELLDAEAYATFLQE
ncbi:MAG: glycine cleavage system protein GcvH [Zetaproteobacteria bacterium]|nr:MAG: glycine cleavage system protein GcvH [Zetaproteobacteria bacterium]